MCGVCICPCWCGGLISPVTVCRYNSAAQRQKKTYCPASPHLLGGHRLFSCAYFLAVDFHYFFSCILIMSTTYFRQRERSHIMKLDVVWFKVLIINVILFKKCVCMFIKNLPVIKNKVFSGIKRTNTICSL